MVDMTTTHLNPGDFVQHPEKGNGVVYDSTPSRVMHRNALGRLSSSNLDGWKRVETVCPGHVQVRVDAYDTAADYLDAVNDNREHDPAIRDLRSQAQCLREDAARAHLRRP